MIQSRLLPRDKPTQRGNQDQRTPTRNADDHQHQQSRNSVGILLHEVEVCVAPERNQNGRRIDDSKRRPWRSRRRTESTARQPSFAGLCTSRRIWQQDSTAAAYPNPEHTPRCSR
uniref:Uncharacterized protein MLCB1222.18 n=1 Tax=Mycobacterium leprae TaxID=1769 RepID=Q9X790_MYCLR|nr:hypothetical protein MLCB1222.18 [Mycobacterium leprae]